jgi:hypothetical protein
LSVASGVLYLLEAQLYKVYQLAACVQHPQIVLPFLPILFKYLATTLASEAPTSQHLKMQLLAVAFSVIEQYPKEAEDQNFTQQVIQTIVTQLSTKDAPIAVQATRKKILTNADAQQHVQGTWSFAGILLRSNNSTGEYCRICLSKK